MVDSISVARVDGFKLGQRSQSAEHANDDLSGKAAATVQILIDNGVSTC